MIAALPSYAHSSHHWGRALGREHLDTLLLRRAAALGTTVLQPWAVRSVAREGAHHVCHVESLHSGDAVPLRVPLRASVLIDAHGSWESDPTGEAPRQPPRGSDLFAFKGNFTGAELDMDLLPVLAFPGGYGGMVLADGGIMTLACCIRRDAMRSIRQRSPGVAAAVAVQGHLAASCGGVRDALRTARQEGAWLSVGPIRPGIRARARSASQFAIGNAAGEAHPILGEGISMAIQSAWLLCDRLIPQYADVTAGRGVAAAGLAYASDWRRSFEPRIRTAALLSQFAMRPASAGWAWPLLRRWPGILTAGARLGGKVTCVVVPPTTQTNKNPATAMPGMSIHRETK